MDSNNINRALRINDVCKITSLAKSTISLWVMQKRFPEPLKLSPTIKVWMEKDISDWLKSQKSP